MIGVHLNAQDACVVRHGRERHRLDVVALLEEEAARLDLSLPPFYDSGATMGAPTIAVWGTEEQKEAFLRPIYRGEVRVW